jgi:hypothetical protein
MLAVRICPRELSIRHSGPDVVTSAARIAAVGYRAASVMGPSVRNSLKFKELTESGSSCPSVTPVDEKLSRLFELVVGSSL